MLNAAKLGAVLMVKYSYLAPCKAGCSRKAADELLEEEEFWTKAQEA